MRQSLLHGGIWQVFYDWTPDARWNLQSISGFAGIGKQGGEVSARYEPGPEAVQMRREHLAIEQLEASFRQFPA